MKTLAADTIVAAQYSIRHVIKDIFLNLIFAIMLSFSISSFVWLFSYVGERMLVVSRMAFKRKNIADPKTKNWGHIIMTTIGFAFPILLLTYFFYMIRYHERFEGINVNDLISSQQLINTKDEASIKLMTAQLLLHYEEICRDQNQEQERKKIDDMVEKIEKGIVENIVLLSENECLKEAFERKITMSELMELELMELERFLEESIDKQIRQNLKGI